MGFFDYFISSEKKKNKTVSRVEENELPYNYTQTQIDENSTNNSSIKVFYPNSYDDVSSIIEVLSIGKSAIVNISKLKDDTAQRVLDLLSGAIYALHGGICKLEKGLYLLSIDGVEIKQ